MPHHPKPFFKAKRNAWSVEISRSQLLLGKHPAHSPPPRKRDGGWDSPRVILDAYHRVMTELQEQPQAPRGAVSSANPPLVAALLDSYLEWLAQRVHDGNKANRTYAWYHDYLQSFLQFLPESQKFTVDKLEP